MKLFDFFKPEKSFAIEIKQINKLNIKENLNSKVIEIEKEITFNNLIQLLKILSKYEISFSIYDCLYPSLSDPGAYISYSKQHNVVENAWSMSLGNQGWTGGIYTIEEKNIVIQIFNLIKLKHINSIQIENIKLFQYDKQNIDYNRNLNSLIYGIHSNVTKIESDYLIFGLFSSDNYSPYYIYKLTKNELFVDKSGTWNSKRHTTNGYIFEGEKLFSNKFEIAKEILNEIPLELLTKKWKGYYTTGNRNEDQLILEFENSEFHKTISIDSYEIETELLPFKIKEYRKKIEKIISQLNE